MIKLLKEYKNVFMWKYTEIPGVDKEVSCHKLNVLPSAILVKQNTRTYKAKLDLKISEEVQRMLTVGFIVPIQNPDLAVQHRAHGK